MSQASRDTKSLPLMASERIRISPKASATRGADQLAGSLAGGLSSVVQLRTHELVACGLTYDEAQAQAEVELFGGLQRSVSEAAHGRR